MPTEIVLNSIARLRKLIGHPTNPRKIWWLERRRTENGTRFISFFVFSDTIPTEPNCLDLMLHHGLGFPIAKDQRGIKVTGELAHVIQEIIEGTEPTVLSTAGMPFVYDNYGSMD